jgi:hypothetical protein
MTNKLRHNSIRFAFAALLPIVGLSTLAVAKPAQGKELGAALTLWANSNQGYKVARWYRCSDASIINGVAAGYNGSNGKVCEVTSGGSTVTTTCGDTAVKHRAWWRAGTFNSAPTSYSANWDEDRNNDMGSVDAWEGSVGICGNRGIRVADMGGS